MKLAEVVKKPSMTKDLRGLMILLTSLTDWKFEQRDPGDPDEHWFRAESPGGDWINVIQFGNDRIVIEFPDKPHLGSMMSKLAERISKAVTRAGFDVVFREGKKEWLS